MRTANPTLNNDLFAQRWGAMAGSDRMTVQGTVNKTGILLAISLVSAFFTWSLFLSSGGKPEAVAGWMTLGAVGGFILAIATVFKKTWAPTLAPLYAFAEGFFLGGISSIFEAQFPGIVIQAVGLTFGTAASLLFAYKSGWVRATETFRTGVMAATGGIALVYFISMILGFFGIPVGFIHSSGPMGILFSAGVVVIAALNLVLDFDFIESGERYGAPKYMEWYAAFGLMVTLVWLYIEILRLLSKLKERR